MILRKKILFEACVLWYISQITTNQVRLNPGGAESSLALMCEAIGSWHVSTFVLPLN
uniref:Uncharacterized protein n=1 Tax=Physcomitrium patens TaxID=3218 RepID=A0A2K1IAV2_PHYPA|nr:hypothetical protein PHYPA_030980 [Physcomitrium patens]